MDKNITIGFTGDVAFSEYTKELYKSPERINKDIYDFLNSNDYNVINFESPITDFSKTKKLALAHKSDKESLDFIKNNIKNPIFSLANNHMMDFGYIGINDTFVNLDNAGIKYIGAGENCFEATKYIILGDDIKIGILAFQYKDYHVATDLKPGPAHDKHIKLIKKQIKELKRKADWIVVIYHGGDEFVNTPLPYIRRKYKKLLKYGADIVVSHHPHTVQGYEKVGEKMIFYSLGNFIFDTNFQRVQLGTEYGEIIKIHFGKDSYSFENINLFNDRESGLIKTIDTYEHFKNIKENYKKDWKREAIRITEIRREIKALKRYRRNYSVDELYIEKSPCTNYMTFEELTNKHYFEDIDKKLAKRIRIARRLRRKIKRKLKKIRNRNYKKYLCRKYAKLFK